MSGFSKVSWNEGMFLRPQHFQQQDRYLSNVQAVRFNQLSPYLWGVHRYELDEHGLGLGQFGIESIDAVFVDGTVIQAPKLEAIPNAIQVPKHIKDELVYLCVAGDKHFGQNIADQDSSDITRFYFKDLAVADNALGSSFPETIQLAKLRSVLKLESEARDGYVNIPLARIIEVTEDGLVKLDNSFIPPLLSIQNNPRMTRIVQETLGMIRQRGEALAGRIAKGQGASNSIADFLMLQVLNRYEPLFTHFLNSAGLHPERLYQEMLSFVGELATFTSHEKRAPAFSNYQHDALTRVFGDLMVCVNQALSVVLEQTAMALPLEQTKFGIQVATLNDKTLLDSAQFVLAIQADLSDEEIRRHLPSRTKIGAVEQIRELVNNQLPGISVSPLPVAPRQVPYHAGFHYFQLDKTSEHWSRLASSGGIAIHLSGHYPGLNMELWAIKA